MLFEIRNDQGDCLIVDSQGAKITSLILNSVRVLTSVTRFDGKAGITHPCSPIFGPDVNNVYGLKQHGSMRDAVCKVIKTGRHELTIEHEIKDKGYPKGMIAKQKIGIKNGVFSLLFSHTNTGNEPAEVNCAEHFYFHTPKGHNGATINGQNIRELMGHSVTGVVVDLKKENVIHIPGLPQLFLEQEGFRKIALWAGLNPETNERDKNYICIEPIENDPKFFGKGNYVIYPGDTRRAYLSLHLKN